MELRAGDYSLVLTPEAGASIARFDWRGQALFRPVCGPSIFDAACFALVPFSNRIAFGRFPAGDATVQLAPNFPQSDHPHTLHGFGWQLPWSVEERGTGHARLRHEYAAAEWPWSYAAEQYFTLSEDGLSHALRLWNLSDKPMPAGLGFHPYFERTSRTVYHGYHRGEWHTAPDGLPVKLQASASAVDWWRGEPVGSRNVDTVYTGRTGPLSVIWPERETMLRIVPCNMLGFTTVYTPPDQNFFCVEPVSHSTDALNRPSPETGLRWLAPGESMQVHVSYQSRQTS